MEPRANDRGAVMTGDSWDLTPSDDLADLTLSEVVQLAQSTPSRVVDEDRVQIAVRFVPPGFRSIMEQLADEHYTSYSRLTRHALDHGMAILDAQPWVAALRSAYQLTRSDAMSGGDQEALARLNQVVSYEFRQQQAFRTTLAVSRETAGRVTDLAMACGTHAPAVGVVTVLVSLLTLHNNRGYRRGLYGEVKAFQRFVIRRTRLLSLGDGESGLSGPRRPARLR